MQRLVVLLGVLTCWATATATAFAAPPPAADAPADPAAPEKIELDFRVRTVQSNAYLSFDENGKVQHENDSFSITLEMAPRGGGSLSEYRDFKLDTVITDTGERLSVKQQPPNQVAQRNFGRNAGNAERGIQVGIQLDRPGANASRLSVLAGSVKVVSAGGAQREAVLGPAKDIEGKRIRIKGIDDSLVIVTRLADQQVRLDLSHALVKLLGGVTFYNGRGQPINADSWGSGGSETRRSLTYRLQWPDDGSIKLVLFSQLQERQVPFIVRDVPLPGARNDGGVDVVVEAVPLGQARLPHERAPDAAPPAGAPGPEGDGKPLAPPREHDPLEVIIEENEG